MASWDEILNEIRKKSPFDEVRRKYLADLSDLTNRNSIIYYSSFLSKSGISGLDINDNDITGFMNAVKGLDKTKGLDLILHTPGGSPTAAEAIVSYLRSKFSDIRVIVPQIAMSAGTLIAFSSKEIVMGKHSSLGPIDPQINGIAALDIISEYNQAQEEVYSKPQTIAFWAPILNKYPPGYIKMVKNAIDLSEVLAKTWLETGMFTTSESETVNSIVSSFNENKESKNHGRHFDVSYCQQKGLKIRQLEDDQNFQDAILSLHHATMITLGDTPNVKIIENNLGKAWIIHNNQ